MEPDEADLVLRAVDRARKVRAEQAAQEGGDVSAETSSRADHHVSGSAGERFQVVVHLDQEVLDADGALVGHPGGRDAPGLRACGERAPGSRV